MDIKSLEERHQCLKIKFLPLQENNISILTKTKNKRLFSGIPLVYSLEFKTMAARGDNRLKLQRV